MTGFPKPSERFQRGIVVATVWGNDNEEDGPIFGTIILLMSEAPYYRVGQIERDGRGGWRWVEGETREYFNINNAVEDFTNSGGDI